MTQSIAVRVRFAPSPTGYLHVGGLRTALYNYLFARKHGGVFVLRIEDTDRTRYVEGAVQNLIDTLHWAGLEYDEGPLKGGAYGPYVQSERLDLYKQHAETLLQSGNAYRCFCTAQRLDEMRKSQEKRRISFKYDRTCLRLTPEQIGENVAKGIPFVVRMKVPDDATVKFHDVIRGNVEFASSQIDDQVIIKSDGYPTYHLANVVDDHLMNITHVIRGEEWLSSTPKHVLLYRYFNWDLPQFAHLPLLLNPDRSKLSKRQGDVAVEDYRKKGYLPEALVNFVALLGWNPGTEQDIFTLNELVEQFSLEHVNKAGAIFDQKKLEWMNAVHLRRMKNEEIANLLSPLLKEPSIESEHIRRNEELYSFDDAERRINEFESLLRHLDIVIKPGSILEQMCLKTMDVLDKHRHPETIDTTQDLRQDLAEVIGLQDIVRKILRHKNHPDFPQLLKHLRLLNDCSPTQNTSAKVTDVGSNKTFELLIGLCCMDVGQNLLLDDPVSSDGKNPDVLVDIDGQCWGFACKVLHSPTSKSFYDNLKKGIDQIQNSKSSTGIVVVNLKNILDHDHYWLLTNKEEYLNGAEPLFSAFRSQHEAFDKLVKEGENVRNNLLSGIDPEHAVALFTNQRAIPGFLLFIQMCTGVMRDDPARPYPSLFGYFSFTPIGSSPTKRQMEVLAALNFAMHDQPNPRRVIAAMRERVTFVNDFREKGSYFFKAPREYDPEVKKKRWKPETSAQMRVLADEFSKLQGNSKEEFEAALHRVAESLKVENAALIHPLRLAVSGVGGGPGVFEIVSIIGKEETVKRIERAVATIKS
jgi:glutamyl-tRNA synthetase